MTSVEAPDVKLFFGRPTGTAGGTLAASFVTACVFFGNIADVIG
jgi:hypothetical protein